MGGLGGVLRGCGGALVSVLVESKLLGLNGQFAQVMVGLGPKFGKIMSNEKFIFSSMVFFSNLHGLAILPGVPPHVDSVPAHDDGVARGVLPHRFSHAVKRHCIRIRINQGAPSVTIYRQTS